MLQKISIKKEKKNSFRSRRTSLLLRLLLFLVSATVHSQATFTSGATATQLATQITGPGITINNPQIISGVGTQLGVFSNGIAGANLQLNTGIILTTSTVAESFTTNSSGGISLGPGTFYNDPDLTGIVSSANRDVVVFQFEAVLDPLATVLTIDYQFMSDEYNEYVCSNINDVFGYFVSGPGISGTQNIALVPGTPNPVTIASINNGTVGSLGNIANCIDLGQSALFTDNTGGAITVEYDGVTNKLRATAKGLTPGATYTVKLAIADSSDGSYDSAVLVNLISGLVDDDGDGITNDVDLDDDNDGIYDVIEDANTDSDNNPLTNPTDTDGDGIPNYLDLDSDGDGIPDNIEAQTTSGYIAPGVFTDVNSDGVNDVYAGGLAPVNTDGTDLDDYLDTDADNDGTNDQTEATISFVGNVGNNGLDNGLEAIDDYADVNGILNNPATLPDADGDVGSGGDVDYRDAITLGDNDGDGINDDADLDDDNDGILDSVESTCDSPTIQFVNTPDAYWTLDNNTNDTSGNAHNENGSASLTYSTTAIQGSHSVNFNGTSHTIRYSQDGGFMEQAYSNISFSAWIMPSSLSGNRIIYEEGGGTNGATLWLNNNILTYSVRNGGGGSQVNVTHQTPLVVDGIWHHVAAVFSNGNITVYLDGIPSSTVPTGYGTISAHGSDGGLGGAFGGTPSSGTTGFYAGLMDAVRYSNTTAWPAASILTEGTKVCAGLNLDMDGDGLNNHLDLDSDGDGIPDNIEAQTTNGYIVPNGVYNIVGIDTAYPNGLIPVNTDGTDTVDYLDVDSDNEGANDTVEASITLTGSVNPNGLDAAVATTSSYTDVNGTINDPTLLPDSDSDLATTGDVDFRDAIVNISVGTGNSLWLRGDIGVIGGAMVTQWVDQSDFNGDGDFSNDANFTAPGGQEPNAVTTLLNFNPTLTFTPANGDVLTFTGNINPRTMYVVYNNTSTTSWTSVFTNNDGNGIGHGHVNDTQIYHSGFTPASVRNGNEYINGLSVNFLSQARPDNFQLQTRIFTSNLSNASHIYYVGRDRNFLDRVIEGSIAEIITFTEAHSDADRQRIESYLGLKYGFTLNATDNSASITEGDYVASDGLTKYWDYTANSSYHNDVAGIGQDNTQVLTQKQSKSVNTNALITIGLGNIATDNASNTNTFSSDKSFLIWGNDNAVLGATSTSGVLCATDLRLDRNWKIVETGTVEEVQIAIPKTTIDAHLTNIARSKVMIVADDISYTTNVEFVVLTEAVINGEIQYTGNYNFDGTKFFTFAEVGGITWSGTTSSWNGGQGVGGAPSTNALDNGELLTIDAEGTTNHATLPENAQVGCVWVTAGSKLMVPSGQFLEIADQLFLEGEIRLIGSAQLIQTHTGVSQVTGLGKIYVDQQGTAATTYRYNYWTSPVSNIGASNFTVDAVMKDGTTPTSETSTATDINFVSGYDGAITNPITISNHWIYGFTNALSGTGWIQQKETGTFDITDGFTFKGPGAVQNYTFVGTPNDGTYTSTISAGYLSLLGNPYPSAIDSQQFFSDNIGVVETLYFWEHKGDSNTHNTGDYIGGYGLLNASMSVAGVAPFNDDTGGQGSFTYTAPGRYIPIGQGFFVSADGSGNVTFNNSQRVFQLENENGGSDSFFFKNQSKTNVLSVPNTNENSLPILKLGFDFINNDGKKLHRQIGISFKSGNKFSKDAGYDSPIFDVNTTDAYFSFNDARQDFIIAGIGEITDDLEFPIAIKIGNTNEITLRVDEIYNIDRDVFLEDKVTNQLYNLKNSIPLSIPIGTYKDRFYIKFGKSALSIDDNPLVKGTKIYMNQQSKELIIENTTGDLLLEKVLIHNVLGQKVKQVSLKENLKEHRISIKELISNLYIISIYSNKGKITKKVFRE